jgi:hypothetical protein
MSSSIGDGTVVKSRAFKMESLVVSFASALAFDTVPANRPLLAALDTPSATSQASGLRTLAGQFGFEGRFRGRNICICPRGVVLVGDGTWLHIWRHANGQSPLYFGV